MAADCHPRSHSAPLDNRRRGHYPLRRAGAPVAVPGPARRPKRAAGFPFGDKDGLTPIFAGVREINFWLRETLWMFQLRSSSWLKGRFKTSPKNLRSGFLESRTGHR